LQLPRRTTARNISAALERAGLTMPDQWTRSQLYRIAASLRFMGYHEAGALVALAAHSVDTQSKRKSGQSQRLLYPRNHTTAALDTVESTATLVPFRRRVERLIDRRDD
jgi:hypothetical protein